MRKYKGTVKTKVCGVCGVEKPVSEFYTSKDTRNKGGKKIYLKYLCKVCDKENGKIQNAKTRRKKRRWLWEYKKSHPCIDCGENNPVCLQFDHVSGKKIMNIGILANGGHSMKSLQKEIEKCVIRCANCHMKKTAKDQNWYHAELKLEGASIDEWNAHYSETIAKGSSTLALPSSTEEDQF